MLLMALPTIARVVGAAAQPTAGFAGRELR